LIKEILNNKYYQTEVKPGLDKTACIDNLINQDVTDIRTFFLREQVIGELRTYVRLEQLLENRAEELTQLLLNQTNKEQDENE
jgi:hypothetical protein